MVKYNVTVRVFTCSKWHIRLHMNRLAIARMLAGII